MTDTVESVLAEMREFATRVSGMYEVGQGLGIANPLREWADRLAAAHARDRADARRYRWVRASTTPGYLHFPNGEIADGLALSALDAAIDAHLSGGEGGGNG